MGAFRDLQFQILIIPPMKKIFEISLKHFTMRHLTQSYSPPKRPLRSFFKAKYALLLLLPLFLFSCEEVIEIELEESGPFLVVEAGLQEGNHPFQVVISYSSSYYDNNLPTPVLDAAVTLIDGEGNEFNIPHASNGIYMLPFEASAGKQYQLRVAVDNQVYEAISFLPEAVPLIDLTAEYQEASPFSEEGYQAYIRFSDPAGEENFYRIRHSIDGTLQNGADDLLISNDNLYDGTEARLPLFQKTFESGDLVEIELIHFGADSYDYFNSLADISGSDGGPGGATAAPGNPTTNWTNGCLGYFSAYNSDKLSLMIP